MNIAVAKDAALSFETYVSILLQYWILWHTVWHAFCEGQVICFHDIHNSEK